VDGNCHLLLPEQYLAIASNPLVLGADDARALANSVLVWDALSAACLAPAGQVDGQDLFPRLCAKAAILGWHLLDLGLPPERWKARAAWLALLEFFGENGGDPWSGDPLAAQTAALYLDTAMDRGLTLEAFTSWLCSEVDAGQ